MTPLIADRNFTVSNSTSTVKSVSYEWAISSAPIFNEGNVDDGHWTTVVDFTVLEGGGVDLDELLERL